MTIERNHGMKNADVRYQEWFKVDYVEMLYDLSCQYLPNILFLKAAVKR